MKEERKKFGIYEKENVNALHSIFDTWERADNHLKNVIPDYVRVGYYDDKTLTKDSFEIRTMEK